MAAGERTPCHGFQIFPVTAFDAPATSHYRLFKALPPLRSLGTSCAIATGAEHCETIGADSLDSIARIAMAKNRRAASSGIGHGHEWGL